MSHVSIPSSSGRESQIDRAGSGTDNALGNLFQTLALASFSSPNPGTERPPRETYSLAHGVDLRSVTTTGDADADVDLGELIGAEEEDGLVELRAEDLGGEQLERLAVDTDQALALHTARDGCETVSDGSTDLLRSNRKSVPVAFFFLPNT